MLLDLVLRPDSFAAPLSPLSVGGVYSLQESSLSTLISYKLPFYGALVQIFPLLLA